MDTKPWWQSKATWASILVTVVGILTMFKIVHIGPVQVDNITAETEGLSQTIVGAIEMILGLIGVWGRLTAKKTLTT